MGLQNLHSRFESGWGLFEIDPGSPSFDACPSGEPPMSDLHDENCRRLGIDAKRIEVAHGLIETWARDAEVPASAFIVGRRTGAIEVRVAGRRTLELGSPPLRDDAIFLAASLTKPIVAVATMMLLERGRITLDDAVAAYLPEFGRNGKEGVRVRHLLTHTSGLPDILPENDALRARHATLSDFVAATCRSPLLFAPGTAVRYQSSGFTILGELVLRLTGRTLPGFLESEIFGPLGMADTSLGWRPERRDRQTAVRIDAQQAQTDWHWNSPYWLGFGSPWGGLVTSASDYGRFLAMMLGDGRSGGVRILAPATVEEMVTNQLDSFPVMPEAERRLRPWGLGWRLRWPGSSAHFGDLLGPRSFGHWGATGTLAWADRARDAFAVILTSQPQQDQGTYLGRLSNVLASAFE